MSTKPRRDDHGIVITRAREHNLKDVCLTIPKGMITVFTGVSGSGKSSVVFDTIAVESQRQLNETFPAFVRNRLPKYEKPEADGIGNLSPAIVVDQKPVGGGSRSTVGTMTDIASLIRLLFSRAGTPSAGMSTAYSFNDPSGACPTCQGLGRTVQLDLDRFFDRSKSLNTGALLFPLFNVGGVQWTLFTRSGLFDNDKPLRSYTKKEWQTLLHGSTDGEVKIELATRMGTQNVTYEGIVDRFNRLYLNRDLSTLSKRTRDAVEKFTTDAECPGCRGARLNAAALKTKVGGLSIADHMAMEITDLIRVLGEVDHPLGTPIARAAIEGLRRIDEIGLGYLHLGRETGSLSGGEGQRLKIVRNLGSSLTGMTYIFDEPSTGLHPRDVHRVGKLLTRLRDQGNTLLIVEHDRDVIALADHVVDMGPGAGTHGGHVVFEGSVAGLRRARTLTGRHLGRALPVKEDVRTPTGHLPVTGASLHNLKNVSVDIPTGVLVAVTGVAGSGKSTLISEEFTARHPEAVFIDQSAIGANSRSTPATWVGIMDTVRKLFADANGVPAGLFSFNSTGACPACGGKGTVTADMAFADPVTTVCESCRGLRYSAEALAHTLRGRTVTDVLALTAEEACAFFTGRGEKGVRAALETLVEVGLGYLTLGQPLSTLSGGERQRLKLAGHLGSRSSIYVLDEPTTGLHMADVETLQRLLDRLVDDGNTVIVIEHNLDVVKRADRVIDMGPEGGRHGGQVLFTGTPAQLLEHRTSHTARALRKDLAA
ncbi:ATP-binding cassette domain-containing protein [Streptomyces roseifaciens]|uniref:ATP-binding cassette domain-containing protein n=1 Tax=Streptomyces roseifaciens TaxID=1488406 RepID=UPI00071815E9|nr:excinuclease ABC subunit UvrA [Streptomyces roseifaciens]